MQHLLADEAAEPPRPGEMRWTPPSTWVAPRSGTYTITAPSGMTFHRTVSQDEEINGTARGSRNEPRSLSRLRDEVDRWRNPAHAGRDVFFGLTEREYHELEYHAERQAGARSLAQFLCDELSVSEASMQRQDNRSYVLRVRFRSQSTASVPPPFLDPALMRDDERAVFQQLRQFLHDVARDNRGTVTEVTYHVSQEDWSLLGRHMALGCRVMGWDLVSNNEVSRGVRRLTFNNRR